MTEHEATTSPPEPTGKRIRSVQKAIEILRLLGRHESLSLSELAREMGSERPTVFHLAQTLADERLVTKDPETRRYKLGPGLIDISPPTSLSTTLSAASQDALFECAQATGFDVWLGLLESDRVFYIARVDGNHPLKLHMPLLKLQPAHAVAAGRVILSDLGRPRVSRILGQHTIRKMTSHTVTDLESVLDAIDLVREQGFAECVEEHIDGASDIAVPVRSPGGVVVAAVSIGAPSHVFDHDARREVLPHLVYAARRIETALAAG